MTILLADSEYAGAIPQGEGISVLRPGRAAAASRTTPVRNLFVVASASELEPIAEYVHRASSAHRLRALFVRADVECTWLVPMLERANVRALHNMLVHTSYKVPERVLRAWDRGAQADLIADATVADDRLLVRTCALKMLEIGFDRIPALAALPVGQRHQFTVDPDGSFVHWETGDVHIGVENLRYALDPQFSQLIDAKRLASQARFGAAVRALRRTRGLRQSDIAGLSAKQVSRIEAGSGTPRTDSLRRLAEAHELDLDAYLGELASAMRE